MSQAAPPSHRAATPPLIDGFGIWKQCFSFFRDQIGALAAMRRQYGPIVVFRGRIPIRNRIVHCAVVSGAKFNRQVLGNPDTYNSAGLLLHGPRESALNRMRRGLIGANGQRHREIRRVVSSLFSPKAVRQYFPAMVEVARRQLDEWPVGKTTDVSAQVSRLSLLVSARTLLSGDHFGEAQRMAEMTAQVLRQSYDFKARFLRLNIVGTPYRRLLKRAEKLERELYKLIDRHEQRADDSPYLFERMIGFHRAEPDRLSREELMGHMVILFAASHETVARSVVWTLFLLTQHPRMLAELHDELWQRCGGQPPTLDDLDSLPLLDAAIKESMRLIPPVPCTLRTVRGHDNLGGFDMGPRDYVLLSHFSTHRDPEVFHHPNQFRPERWFGDPPESFAYLPFSAGPRTCIGKTLGTAIIRLLLAMIVQRFRLTAAPRSRIDRSFQVTLAPKYGMPMAVELQDGRFEAAPVRGNVHELVDLSRSDATTSAPAVSRTPDEIPVEESLFAA